eukprot:2612661-Rhodomonas_salina.2
MKNSGFITLWIMHRNRTRDPGCKSSTRRTALSKGTCIAQGTRQEHPNPPPYCPPQSSRDTSGSQPITGPGFPHGTEMWMHCQLPSRSSRTRPREARGGGGRVPCSSAPVPRSCSPI